MPNDLFRQTEHVASQSFIHSFSHSTIHSVVVEPCQCPLHLPVVRTTTDDCIKVISHSVHFDQLYKQRLFSTTLWKEKKKKKKKKKKRKKWRKKINEKTEAHKKCCQMYTAAVA